jgi:hypothetical protein
MMKDGKSISIEEQNKRGCIGCDNLKIYPHDMVELCILPKNECTHGNNMAMKSKKWQFDLTKCPDCNTLQRMKPMIEGSKCDSSGVPRLCASVVVVCTKGKHKGELMWSNENWD